MTGTIDLSEDSSTGDLLIGGHISIAGGLHAAPPRAGRLNFRTMQIFVKNQRQWRAPPLGQEDADAFEAARSSSGIERVLAHGSYLINVASPDEAQRTKSVTALLDELVRCARLGVDGLVLHPGAHSGSGPEEGLVTVAGSVDECLDRVEENGVPILLETTAGQGTSLGHRLEHLAIVRDKSRHPGKLGVCVDTCHIFAAGYDIDTAQGWASFWDAFDRLLGKEALAAVHINDSKKPKGSRVDRHERLGQGLLGTYPFTRLLSEERFRGIPLILETPGGEVHYAKQIAWLRELGSGAVF